MKIEVKCPKCKTNRLVNKYYHKYNPNAFCRKCSHLKTDKKNISKKISKSLKNKWNDDDYRNKITKILNSNAQNDHIKNKIQKTNKKTWAKNSTKSKHKAAMKEKWQDEEWAERVREKLVKRNKSPESAIARSKINRVSSVQKKFYSILDDLEISYTPEPDGEIDKSHECVFGPYIVDCIIHTNTDQKDIIVEINGDYWHKNRYDLDRSKRSYITKHFNYDYKVLWEHEFLNTKRIKNLVMQWCNLKNYAIKQFDFSSLEIKKVSHKEVLKFLDKYHYLGGAPRGGLIIGFYCKDVLVCVCTFSPPVRQNIAKQFGLKSKEIYELSRFCIHPKYQKKNFASWAISKSIKLLKKHADKKLIVAYADKSFNHEGTIYKASNFEHHGIVRPDYWYVDDKGWVMHKKKVYNHASRNGLKEAEFVKKHGYKKVVGDVKNRYIYRLD